MRYQVSLGAVSRPLTEKPSLYDGHLGLIGLVAITLPAYERLYPAFPGGSSPLLAQQFGPSKKDGEGK